MCVVFFFFFKQKTAYEMRISDWSSDVCSSDLKGRFIYYVGPVDPVGDEVVGPAGPTTATRMDKFTRQILESTGLLGMIGKSERGPIAIEAIKYNKAVYLLSVGGAAYLVAQEVKQSKVMHFAELGEESRKE